MKKQNVKPNEETKNDPAEYCRGCLKFDEKTETCIAFKQLWEEWNEPGTECWSREEDPSQMLNMIKQVDRYEEQGIAPQTPNGWRNQIKELKSRMEEMEAAQINAEIAEVYNEDMRRGKGGGGEKNKDGSAFGPQELKNNKFMHRNMQKSDWKEWRS